MKPTHSRSFTDGGGNAGTVGTRPLRILSPIGHNAKPFLLILPHSEGRDDPGSLGVGKNLPRFWEKVEMV
jgi:hypothetical protein